MGLFGSKKTYVSSTIYNMAGDIKDRPNFLKTLLTNHALNEQSGSLGSSIQQAYLQGPGTRLRSFGRWAKDHYGQVGVPTANLYTQIEVSSELVTPYMPHDPAEVVNVQRVDAKLADYSFWAEQWMLDNYPDQIGTAWSSNYDDVTGEIHVTLVNGVSATFVPTDFKKSASYIYVLYTTVRGQEAGPVEQGTTYTIPEGGSFPSTSGWTTTGSTTVSTPVVLNRVETRTASYSDGRPDEVTTTPTLDNQTYNRFDGSYRRNTYQGGASDIDQLYSKTELMYFHLEGEITQDISVTETKEELEDGKLIRRTKIEVKQDKLVLKRTYRTDSQLVASQTRSPAKLFIYRLGSGNQGLDDTVKQAPDTGYYFPFIPLRLDNKFVSDSYQKSVYDQSVKAYKKATSGAYDDLIDDLAENKSLPDIDYAYIMFGVSLNTREKTGKKYLYEFFDRLRLSQSGSTGNYQQWQTEQSTYDNASQAWINWREAQDDPSNPLFGSAAPNVPGSTALPVREVRIRGNGAVDTNLDMQISWQTITRQLGTGLKKPGAKMGDYWVEFLGKNTYAAPTYNNGVQMPSDRIVVDTLSISWQVTANSWRTLMITGLVHKNFIYKGKFVEINAQAAMADAEESGFLVPLHYDVFRSLSTVESTQLSTACCYMVINSYLVKKTGFFSSFFFKILLFVAVIAITVATGGIGASSAGLLGTNVAVGAALGATGTLAVIIGAVANAVVAMVVARIITAGAGLVFGDKLGAIIGAIAAAVSLQVGTALQNGSSMSSLIGSLGKAQNIMAMTSAVGSGVSGYIQAGAMETAQKTAKLQQDYQTKTKEFQDQYESEFGYGRAIIDTLSLTQANQFVSESSTAFLERTLMTGSDVAEMSLSLLSNFTDITLSMELSK